MSASAVRPRQYLCAYARDRLMRRARRAICRFLRGRDLAASLQAYLFSCAAIAASIPFPRKLSAGAFLSRKHPLGRSRRRIDGPKPPQSVPTSVSRKSSAN